MNKLAKSFLTLISIAGFGTMAAFAQSDLQPPPENLKVAEQPDSPLQLSINKMRVDPKYGQSLSYSVKNTGTVNVIGFVVDGMPGTTQRAVPLDAPLLPGMAKSFIIFIYPEKEVTGEHLAKVDFVLRQDGSTWGARETGDADFVVNFFDGLKRVIVDSKRLVAEGDHAKLTTFIKNAPNFPENGGDMTKRTRKQEGFMRGFGVGLISFRESLTVRGDLKGIPGKIADLEQSLGARKSSPGDPKRISMYPSVELPIKIVDISIGKEPVSFDQNMPARPDWLKGLTFRIKNTSGKTIRRVVFDLRFPETEGGNGMTYSLYYGPPVLPDIPVLDTDETPIPPNSVFEYGLDEREFGRLKKFIESRQSLDTLTRMKIYFSYVHFDDNTGWNSGPTMQDPENPRRWISVRP
ncbi:MAG: hypothetical protein ABL999_17125 [Pyrinomonadaceae bacterium]